MPAIHGESGAAGEIYPYPGIRTQTDTRTPFILNRGYTMHEHLPEFNLINMNGRVYEQYRLIIIRY
jgi:hypothetical protein